MAEMIINSNNNWQLKDTSEKVIYTKTLKTAGQFVDRDIEIAVTAKSGSVGIDNQTVMVAPKIEYIKDSDSYTINVNDTISILPKITEGWVSTGTSGTIYVQGSNDMRKTSVEGELIPDSDSNSGYFVYAVSASPGYNDHIISYNINVYQGEYSQSEVF